MSDNVLSDDSIGASDSGSDDSIFASDDSIGESDDDSIVASDDDRSIETSIPFVARSIAGWIISAKLNFPNLSWACSKPATVPGTPLE